MIGLVISSAKSFKALQLVRIQFPIINQSNAEKENNFDENSFSIFRTTQEDADLCTVLCNLQALDEHPFVAWPIGPALIQVVCPKAVVAKLFKALFAQQRTLGIRLTDLKSHVILTPMDPEELLQAVSADILSALKTHSGWHRVHRPNPDQAGTVLLGVDPMDTSVADGKVHNTPLLDMHVEISGSDTLVLFLKPSTVRFRHSTIAAFSNPGTLAGASKAAEGSLCRVLPTLTPAIIQKLRIVSDEEAEKIKNEWSRAGFSPSSPRTAWHQVVDVRFEEDVDAPTTPFPACAVLSYLVYDPEDTKLNSRGVIGALQRVQEDLKNAAYQLFGSGGGGGGLAIKEMRRWDDTTNTFKGKTTPVPATTGFQSAASMMMEAAAPAVPPPTAVEKLGEVIDFSSLQRDLGGGENGYSVDNTAKTRIKKPHARAGPELLAYLARLEKEEADEAAAAALNNPQKKTALPPSMVLAAQNAQAAPRKKTPLLGSKRALPTAAEKAATAKAPKKAAGAAPKAPKPPAAEIDVAALDVPGLAATNKLATLTIPQLKAYCRSIKLPVGGKKSDLEARIKTHLGISIEQ